MKTTKLNKPCGESMHEQNRYKDVFKGSQPDEIKQHTNDNAKKERELKEEPI